MKSAFVAVIPGAAAGGVAQIGLEIARCVARAGEVTTTIIAADGAAADRARSGGLACQLAPPIVEVSGSFRERVNRARTELERVRPAIVYAGAIANSAWAVAAKQLGARVVLHACELERELDRLLRSGATCLDVCAAADLLVTSGRDVIVGVQRKLGYVPEDVVDIGATVDLAEIVRQTRREWQARWRHSRPFEPSARGVAASRGRACDGHGYNNLAETARLLPEWDFVWLDDGSADLPGADDWPETPAVPANFYHAAIDNPYPLLARSDVIVLAGQEPRSGAEIQELLALGVPVIGFGRSLDHAAAFADRVYLLHGTPDCSRLAMTIAKFEPGAGSRQAQVAADEPLVESAGFQRLLAALRERGFGFRAAEASGGPAAPVRPVLPLGLRLSPPISRSQPLRARIEASRLFDPDAYRSLNKDLQGGNTNLLDHFMKYGLAEGRCFTTPDVVARALAIFHPQLEQASLDFATMAEQLAGAEPVSRPASRLRQSGTRVGVFSSSVGNFYMREIADLLCWGLQAEGIDAVSRDEAAQRNEKLDIRIFVAPHEFFFLGLGTDWQSIADAPGSVLYNVEQPQSQWFNLTFALLLKAPLVLDINLQTAELLKQAGCLAVHFMPGYLAASPYTRSAVDASDIELLKGYRFARQPYDWRAQDRLEDRPIDVLFIGSSSPRRDSTLTKLSELSDRHRFLCVYTRQEQPLNSEHYRATSTAINCALSQRSKIVLNIHRDWLGYFEWSRVVLQGFWQGACVVADRGLPHPIFKPGVHYIEESMRHLSELMRWLLETEDGRARLDETRRAAYDTAVNIGSMRVCLAPVLAALEGLLEDQETDVSRMYDARKALA